MKIPKRLKPLLEDGLIDDVIQSLMSGKEASVYLVRCNSEIRCAKVYKDAASRSFKKAVQYREGRKVRNSRRQRAMDKGSNFGRAQQEEIWQNTEMEALERVARMGVRVPETYGCFDGVLLMDLITDESGEPAPRLNDIALSADDASRDHALMMTYVMKMLCTGLIHGDLSEFNVLMGQDGPVIIDMPQAVEAAANNQAKTMLARDVNNMTRYYGQFEPALFTTNYAGELWSLFEQSELHPDMTLTGVFDDDTTRVDVDAVLQHIEAARQEEAERQARLREAHGSD